tara:strand:- start:55 stop:447 length:393 start_codon:yes stop_codon:yes gene_type:complete
VGSSEKLNGGIITSAGATLHYEVASEKVFISRVILYNYASRERDLTNAFERLIEVAKKHSKKKIYCKLGYNIDIDYFLWYCHERKLDLKVVLNEDKKVLIPSKDFSFIEKITWKMTSSEVPPIYVEIFVE